MVDLETPQDTRKPDRTTRSAALWAAAVAVPVALLTGLVMFWRLAPAAEEAGPAPTTTAATVPAAPVPMDVPRLDAGTARACLAVTARLPGRLRDLPSRRVSAGPEQNAAWGEPPITVACGVTPPVMCASATGGAPGCVPLDAIMMRMDGVCWWSEDGPATDVFTTIDREVAVRVSVPGGYGHSAQWANEFSGIVAQTLKPTSTGVPSGCR
jgi:hypothetical protein